MMNTLAAAGLAVTLASSFASAQTNSAFTLSGLVEKASATSVSVRNDDGGTVETYALGQNLIVLQNKVATLADIKPNDFVASAAMTGPDGKLHSTELRIFPEAMRGLGEGQRPMNDARHQTMTNATVTGAVVVNGSNTITVTFANGGKAELILDPGVPVTRIDVADRALVRSGAKVRVQGMREASGAVATRITIQ
ncbi:MAG: hypothetical protein CFE31_12535 [Rhizobiales bacterium PAR1]|nr:MAG: hypothetical protein CFE31_12535 [Rhizobiales bacterium PAR1]